VLMGTYRHRSPWMRLRGDFGQIDVVMAIASNTGPYAYLAGRPIEIAPNVRLDAGLDVFALKTMRIENLPSYALRCLLRGDITEHPDAFYASDCTWFELSAAESFERHVDGEPLTPATKTRFSLIEGAVTVRA
jgi:diacylglycerol kinase family enzyme